MKNQVDKNGKRHGLWEEYYSDGKIRYRGNYRNGLLHGCWEWYYGRLWYKGVCKRGNPVGLWHSIFK